MSSKIILYHYWGLRDESFDGSVFCHCAGEYDCCI